jgi:hypothetical protein
MGAGVGAPEPAPAVVAARRVSFFSPSLSLSSLFHLFPLFPELELVAESCPAQLVLVLVAPLAARAVDVVQAVPPAPLPPLGGG